MIDMIGAIACTAAYAIVVGVLVSSSSERVSARLVAFTVAAVWAVVIVAIASLDGFAPGSTGAIPAVAFAFLAAIAVLFGLWFLLPRFRRALLAVPLPALIGLNALRLGGVFFLLLAAAGRLSAPFAPIAGWGDIAIGALAIPLAVMAAREVGKPPAWTGPWNILGALDLVAAIVLGVLSAPGTPIRVFTEGPGTLAIGGLPWIMIPALLVPLFLLIHFTIAHKLAMAKA